ncbi:MAG: response regulator [Chitinivibrionales bacterium]|nr:response regulator [Chitinivibrionales bacterium]
MNRKILVIEDEKDIAELVKLVLETESFTVETVTDPVEAVDTARSFLPDAILLDLTMPKIDGWQIFRVLRKDKNFDHVPIAILTAKSDQFDTMVGLHVMNADGYITKPFGKQELINKINELLRKKEK